MIRAVPYRLIMVIPLALAGCTGMKTISTDNRLFVGHEVTFTDHHAPKKKLTTAIRGVLKPEPNKTFLWMRPSLAFNNTLSEKKKKKKFWVNKIATPVLLSQINPEQVSVAIQNRIFHNGYFQNSVRYDTLFVGHKKAKYSYTITLHSPYRYESVTFPKVEDDLSEKINNIRHLSLLKKGEIYTLDAVKNERIRIDRELKEQGYIYFNPDFITVRADSISGNHQINAAITVKPDTPPESRRAYTIRNIYLHDDHTLDQKPADTIAYGQYFLISQHKSLRFSTLQRGLFLKPGERFARSDYMHTIRYMNELPIVRHTNIKFAPYANTDSLDVILYVSQRKRFAYTAEFNAIFRSTNYFGPGIDFQLHRPE
jgi:outer membrane protein insertion porin family